MRRKVTRKKRSTPTKSRLLPLRGFSTLTILILIVIIGSVFLVGGVIPKELGPLPKDRTEVVLDTSSSGSAKQKESLQLQTLKFKECASTATVDLLLDRSGSMEYKTPSNAQKIDRLKEAVMALTGKFTDDSIIGVQSFSSSGTTPPLTNNFRNDVPVSYFRDVKSTFADHINALQPNGGTPTHDALQFSYDILKEALPKYPDRKFNFIFVSDGAPCPGVGCQGTPGQNQDPRLYTPNPAQEIKDLGVNVYSLAIYDSDKANQQDFENLMKDVASKPENYFAANSADDTTRLLTSIVEKICQ